MLPPFTKKRKVYSEYNVFEKGDRYDVILGRDLGQDLGINILSDRKMFQWDEIEFPMVPRGYWNGEKIESSMKNVNPKRVEEANKLHYQ